MGTKKGLKIQLGQMGTKTNNVKNPTGADGNKNL